MRILNNIQSPGFKTPHNYFDSLEEKLSSTVLETQEQSQSAVPEGYFEGLEDQIMQAISGASVLDKNLSSGLKVPEGYLSSLEDTISKQTTKETKVIPFFTKRNLLYVSSIAAAIIIMFSVFINAEETTFENIDVDLVEDYIIDQNIDSYQLASLLNDQELNNQDFIDLDMFSDDAEDYLIDNTDIEELMNE